MSSPLSDSAIAARVGLKSPTPPSRSSRLIALDGLRGVAAVVVVLWHFSTVVGRSPATSMMAVDLFFLISGYVIPYAYERRLKAGMSLGRFLVARMVRLYPLYILGVGINFAPFVHLAAVEGRWQLREPLYWLLWAVPLLPCIPSGPEQSFLLNPPAWSLFLEMVVNIAWAAALPRLRTRVLAAICAASTAGFALLAASYGTFNFGAGGWQLFAGLVRTTAPFSLGVLLHRGWPSGWRELPAPWALVAPGAFLLTLTMPTGSAAWGVANVAVIICLFPLLVMTAVSARPTGAIESALHWLGELSYPLYALHIPIFLAGTQFVGMIFGVTGHRATAMLLPVAFAAAFASIFVYDRPIRSRLEHALGLRRRDVDAAPPL